MRFTGFRNQSELPSFYSLCDVFVLPSLLEPWGLVVNEVMTAGRAVVASDQVGAVFDLIRDGENGYVFPAGDVDALTTSLSNIVSDSALSERMGQRSLGNYRKLGISGGHRRAKKRPHLFPVEGPKVNEANAPTPHAAEQGRGIHRRLVQGVAGKAVGTAIIFGEQILLVPVFLLFWSPGQYGDWLVLLSTAGFIGLLDTGLSAYYGNALQQALARGKHEEFSTLLKQGVFFYTTLITLGLLVALIVGYQVSWPELLNLKTLSTLTAAQVFCFLSAYFLLMLPFGFISSVYRAHGEFITSVMVNNLMRLGLIACIATMLSFGVSTNFLALTYVAIGLLTWLGIILHQKHRYPDLRYGIAVPDKEAFRTALTIGPAYAVVPAAMALTIHGTILLISALASSGATICCV